MKRTWYMAIPCAFAAAALLAGCENSGSQYKTAQQIKQEKQAAGKPVHDEHEHESTGPHGGAIIELGDEEYHGELIVDGERHALVVYLLGPDAKTPAPIDATEVTVVTEDQTPLKLKAAPQEGDGEGLSSKFESSEEAAVKPIVEAGFLHGALQLEVKGKPYHGDIDAHFDGGAHEDHDDDMDASESTEKPTDPAKESAAESTAPGSPAKPED